MLHHQLTALKTIFAGIISTHVSPEAFAWLNEKGASQANSAQFNAAFVSLPRKTGRITLLPDQKTQDQIKSLRPGLTINGWTADRLARVWLLMQLDGSDQKSYFRTIENLFLAAEVNELVALYSALPVFEHPEMWVARCAEGIRNNIADVLTAIMCNNPYPSEHLDEPAWNQLVLKAFFTEKPVNRIVGLDKRANEKLASTLSDYAHERWAAQRPVNPLLWWCVGPFINENILPDISRILSSDNIHEREAGALACHASNYPPAKKLIPEDLRKNIEAGKLSWDILAEKINDYVLQ